MKKVSFLLLLIITVSCYMSGQEDTVRVNIQYPSGPVQTDSSSLHKKNPRMDIQDDFNDFNAPFSHQEPDRMTVDLSTLNKKRNFFHASYAKFIIPAAMLSYGLLAQENDKLKALDKSTTHEIKEHYQGRFPVDDYMQYAPYAAYYGLDICGIKAKHNFRDRTIVMLTSFAIMNVAVAGMKKGFRVERPSGASNNSFPSGHTATAFLGAHLLFLEYKDVSPWIGVAGYLSAGTVGSLRVINKKHWVSDVVAGAGIGILSAEAGYLLLPVCHHLLGIHEKDKSLAIAPAITPESLGVGLAYSF